MVLKLLFRKLVNSTHFLALVVVIHGCMGINEEQSDHADVQKIEDYIIANQINAHKTTHGFFYEIVSSSGSNVKPTPGDFVGIYYKLKLFNGKPLDSLVAGTPMRFRHLFTNLYPEAINLGISLMGKGDSYRFYIPSYLAYHDFKVDTLMPAYSNIIADVTLISLTDSIGQVQYELESISNDLDQKDEYTSISGVFYRKVESGQGYLPTANEQVKITYSRWLSNGKPVDSGSATFSINNIPNKFKGIGEWLKKMNKGETAVIVVPSHKAFWDHSVLTNSSGMSTFKVIPEAFAPEILIPSFSTLVYEVKLHESLQ